MMRIATWNLERPKLGGAAKNAHRNRQLEALNADIWILTETSSACGVPGYESHATPALPNYHKAGENYTTISSRYPIRKHIPTWNGHLSACVEIDSPIGPTLVYGTIIAYANYRGLDGTSKRWVEHRKSIQAQGEDWVHLVQNYPKHALVVAGDFNQSRDGSGWYTNREAAAALTAALASAGLRCLTEGDYRTRFNLDRGNIDHICVGGHLLNRQASAGAWPGIANGVRMSDHNGVYVDIDA